MQISLNTTVQTAPVQAGFNQVLKSRRDECGPHLKEQHSKPESREEKTISHRQKGRCQDVSARLRSAAEKELSAFSRAVEELFGPKRAQESINDWIEAIAGMDWSNGQASPDWRAVTIAAAARLTTRQ